MDNLGAALKGIYRDVLIDQDRGVVFDSGWNSNTIVDTGRILLARFMKDDIYTLSKKKKLIVGSGAPSWDDNGLPEQGRTSRTGLLTPAVEDPLKVSMAFLTQSLGDSQSIAATNILQITTVLPVGYPAPVHDSGLDSYPLREFGLFIDVAKLDDLNNPIPEQYMINWITHPVIHKGPTSSLIREIRLHF